VPAPQTKELNVSALMRRSARRVGANKRREPSQVSVAAMPSTPATIQTDMPVAYRISLSRFTRSALVWLAIIGNSLRHQEQKLWQTAGHRGGRSIRLLWTSLTIDSNTARPSVSWERGGNIETGSIHALAPLDYRPPAAETTAAAAHPHRLQPRRGTLRYLHERLSGRRRCAAGWRCRSTRSGCWAASRTKCGRPYRGRSRACRCRNRASDIPSLCRYRDRACQ